MSTRREFLEHAGALGLGAVFLPLTGGIVRAETPAAQAIPGLIFKTIEAGGISHYSYFIGDTTTGKAAVIDPKRDVEDYLELARKHGLTITHAIETHVHADFVSGSRELAHHAGAKICASVEGGAKYGFAITPVCDGDVLKVGNIHLKAIHTPGHTPEHMAFLATVRGDMKQAWALFTGDFLFAGAVGRPDLMGVENTDRLAKQLYASIQSAFDGLPDALPIFPAHGPGSPCGAGIIEREGQATLGLERRTNPALQFKNEKAFIDNLLSMQPPVPYYWPRMKEINARGPKVLGDLPEPRPLPLKDFKKLVSSGKVQLFDTRHMLGFGGGHIAGALNMGYSSSISMWGGWLLDPEKPIALVLPEQGKARDVVAWLVRVGVTKFAGMLDGGMNAWVQAGEPFESVEQWSVHQLRERMEAGDVQVLDVRTPSEWDQGHVPGARYMFLPEISERMHELDASKPIAVYCGTGYRSSIASSLLKQGGFTVYNIPGSITAWLAAGHDIDVPRRPGKASDTRRPSEAGL